MDHAIHCKAILKWGIALLLAGVMGMLTGCSPSTEPADVLQDAVAYQNEAMPNPRFGSQNGDWTVIALSQSESPMSEEVREVYRADVAKVVKENNGVLSKTKYTEYSRVVLALTAAGLDPTDIEGYNLLEPLADYNNVVKQGLNGAIFALLALDCGAYEVPQADFREITTRDQLLSFIMSREIEGGGFAMDKDSKTAEPDISAMALQALAPYSDREEVKGAIDRALLMLSDRQAEDGSFVDASGDEFGSEAISQAMIALSILGVDCQSDERFVKGKGSLYDAFLEYRMRDGGFAHLRGDGASNNMATEQALCALVALQRYENGKSGFYTMTK